MRAPKQIAVRCNGCGQVYHVPVKEAERLAKCRRCGEEFLIPLPNVTNETDFISRCGSRAVADRITAASIAAAVFKPRRRGSRQRFVIIGGLLLALGTVLVLTALQPGRLSRHAAARNLQQWRVEKLAGAHNGPAHASAVTLVEAVEPSVVHIETNSGFASGFVAHESGLIVTCYHCIEEATRASVVFASGRRMEVLGTARIAPQHDLAVLVIRPHRSLVPLPLVDEEPKKGEPVVAFGSPAGLSFSISEGSVSGMRRAGTLARLPGEFRRSVGLSSATKLVQISASVMPGNSGGPVVNVAGNVVGVCAFVLSWEGQSYQFCISAEDIRQVLSELDVEIRPLGGADNDLSK
jgi:S1-C subfamily serine protease